MDGRKQCSGGTPDCTAGIISGPRAVATFQSSDDGRCHGVVARACGEIVDVEHDCQGGIQARTVLAVLSGPVAIAGYFSSRDGFRHVIVGTATGELFDIRSKPGIASTSVRLANISDLGPISSVAAWVDARGNQNIAILTTKQGSRSLSVYHSRPMQPGAVRFLRSFPGNDTIDIAGQYLHSDDTNKLELALSPEGSPSTLVMGSWSSQIVPDESNVQWNFAGTSTPWVTNFPGPQTTSQKILSLSGTAGVQLVYTAWSKSLVIAFIGDDNKLQIFSANNGGGTLAPGGFSPLGTLSSTKLRSVGGPFFTRAANNMPVRIELVTATADHRLIALHATEPASNGVPAWQFSDLGTF